MTYPPGQNPQPGQSPPPHGHPVPPPVYVNVQQSVQQHTHIGGGRRARWTFWEVMLVLFTCGLAWPYVWVRHRRRRKVIYLR